MPKPRPEASGLAQIIERAERRYRVSPLLLPTAAAEAIGISKITLVRWRRDERLLPHAVIKRKNQAPIPLYGPEQITAGQALRGNIPSGPSPVKKRATAPRKVRIFNADNSAHRATG